MYANKLILKSALVLTFLLTSLLSPAGAQTSFAVELGCEGNVEFNTFNHMKQKIRMLIETSPADNSSPIAFWEWNDLEINFTSTDFQYKTENTYTWHQSEHRQEEERIQTRLMLRFDSNNDSYILIQNNPDKIFSQGKCREHQPG